MNYSEEFFEKLLKENKQKIYRICRIYAVSPVEPQDLFQEVIFQVWKSLPSFKEHSSISTWVYKIALNVCMRSKLRFEKTNLKTIRFEAIQFVPTDQIPAPFEDEKFKYLKECISTLNEPEASIIILYLDELPYKEIASITGLSENNIAVRMKRIRKKLLKCIKTKTIC